MGNWDDVFDTINFYEIVFVGITLFALVVGIVIGVR